MKSVPRSVSLLGSLGVVAAVAIACGAGNSGSPVAAGLPSEPAPSLDEAGAPPVVAVTDPLSESELLRTVSVLAADDMMGRDEGSPASKKARAFLVDELTKCGVAPAVSGSFEQPIVGGKGVNVLGRIDGTDPARKARTIVLGAHYDHIGECGGKICNGADDNAAGVSLVVAVACAVAREPLARSVLVALWDAEEPPTFLSGKMGSQYYAANPVVPLDETDVAFALDLVGSDLWPGNNGHFVMGGELSAEVAQALDKTAVPDGLALRRFGLHLAEERVTGGRQPWSDYDAFRNMNVPVVFLSNGQNKRYHQPTDELESLDLPKMALEARYLHGAVRALGSADKTPTFVAKGQDYALDARSVQSILESALGAGGIVEALGLSETSRAKLKSDLDTVTAINGAGTKPTAADAVKLRVAAQRLMCLSGSQYPEAACASF